MELIEDGKFKKAEENLDALKATYIAYVNLEKSQGTDISREIRDRVKQVKADIEQAERELQK